MLIDDEINFKQVDVKNKTGSSNNKVGSMNGTDDFRTMNSIRLTKSMLSQDISKRIIRRAPDKQLDICGGFLIVAYLKRIVYVYIDDILNMPEPSNELIIEKEFKESEF